ncbi:hypothetical protein DWX43_17090 [Clostridium sp. AF19-22AC]|mgnify:CR=1 FL=1|jgi:hypothetical protein|uniref:hypothetical protein n=1 Tax=Clostridia TaxID=186801 RepID=UPI000E526741|nr:MULTISPECIES: hypothetical protein [Clostridia]RHR25839.1 hypothetical protein DWX43_17090 [Clostridium sp. AF19-22AC]
MNKDKILAPFELQFLNDGLLIRERKDFYLPYKQIIWMQMKKFERQSGRWALTLKPCFDPEPGDRGYLVLQEEGGDFYEIHFPRYTGTPKQPGELFYLIKEHCPGAATDDSPRNITYLGGGT